MLTNNIIEHSSSQWALPVILIPKGDNSFRVCTDLRRVNQLIQTDAYPLPRLDDCIDRVAHETFIIKLDILKGYYAIPLAENAKQVLAITTPFGLYQYCRTPFGLKTAPAVLMRLMDTLLMDVPNVSVYLDDVVVATDTWEEHMDTLTEIFGRLKRANLTIHLSKCEFSRAPVTFLGHTVGHGCVSPLTAKVKCILDYPAPRTRKGVRRFLGMCAYYRQFYANFATIAAPITN